MKCLHCDGNAFEAKNCRFTPEIKGEVVEVIVPAMVCSNCHTPLMNDEQMSHLRRAAADAFGFSPLQAISRIAMLSVH